MTVFFIKCNSDNVKRHCCIGIKIGSSDFTFPQIINVFKPSMTQFPPL